MAASIQFESLSGNTEFKQILKSKKVIGMHWGTVVLSLEPIMEPPVRLKTSAEKYGFSKKDVMTFKIGQVSKLSDIIN